MRERGSDAGAEGADEQSAPKQTARLAIENRGALQGGWGFPRAGGGWWPLKAARGRGTLRPRPEVRMPRLPSLYSARDARGLHARRGRAGFTLIEIMIVIAIIGILTSAGYIIARDIVPQYRTRQAAMDFATQVGQCRNLAIASGKRCRIQMLTADSDLDNLDANYGKYSIDLEIADGAGWDTLPVDTFTDTTDDNEVSGIIDLAPDTPTGKKHVAIADWGALAGPGTGNDDAIVFDTRGFLDNPATDFTSGLISITFVNKVAEAKGVPDRWEVAITRAGLAKMVSNRRSTDDNFTASGTATTTTYDPGGSFGAP